MNWDVFVSHASDDKEKFVIPLVNKLKNYGLNVWFDKFELKVGDSLSRSIDEGLRESNFGIVVLSKAFFGRNWTSYELESLINRQVEKGKVILPIWYDITKEEIQKYSFYLANQIALDYNSMGLIEIVESLIEVIQPNIYKAIQNLHRTEKIYKQSKMKLVKSADISKIMEDKIRTKPPRHKELSLDIMILLRLIHSIYYETDNVTYEERIKLYKYNTNPQREILIEIKNATVFLEKTINKNYDIDKRKFILALINLLSFYNNLKYEESGESDISKEEFEDIKATFNSFVPNMDKFKSGLILIT